MKYYLITLSFLLSLISPKMSAQEKAGAVLLSGNINYNSYSYDSDFSGSVQQRESGSYLRINPKIGFYVSKYVILGFGGGIIKTSNKYDSELNNIEEKQEATIRFINIYTAFQSSITERLRFNFNIDFRRGWGTSDYKLNADNIEGKLKESELLLQPGLMYFLSEQFSISIHYGAFEYYKGVETVDLDFGPNPGEIENVQTGTNLNFGIDSFNFGINFIFP